MPIIILIPAVICVVALFRGSVQKAFLDVYLPVFTLLPVYYFWKVASLPPIDFAEAALFPLGVAIFLKEIKRWRFSAMDACVALFVFTGSYADSLHDHSAASKFQLFSNLCVAVVPYMAGKLLIEHNGMRVAAVKRLVFCLFAASIVSVYEYRMERNPFAVLMTPLFPDEHFAWKTQIRWGFGRVSGPFGQSELAGMMLFTGLVLTLWLGYCHLWEPKFVHARWLPLKKSTVIAWTLGIVLLMTQARGPWIGALVALPIAWIGRTRRVLLASVLFGAFAVSAGAVAYFGLKAYTSAPTQTSEQENATYRAHLLDNYLPVARQGGPWGWGQDFPRVGGQGSIDNEYLFVALTQGWAGLAAFCLLAAGSFYHLILAAIQSVSRRERSFAFSLIGIMAGLLVTIFTVFLGNQPYELFFLLAGWSQAVRVRPAAQAAFSFEQVYT